MPTQSQANKRRTDASVSGNSNASGKRSRVSRACDQCRTAREKCDGQAVCSTCSASRRACTYTASPKKRGIQPGYIRTLELALTWVFNNSEAETLLNKKLAQEGLSSILLGKDTKESNKLHKSWRKSKFCRDIDKLLSGENIGEDDSRSPESDDPDTETEDTIHQDLLEPTLSNSLIPPTQFAPRTNNVKVSNPSLHGTHGTHGTQMISLPMKRWRLFDIYFAYTHCWFPICEKHDVLKLSYSYPEEGLALSARMSDSGEHAELWSLLALASLQDKTGQSQPSSRRDQSDTTNPAHVYDIARSLIPLETNSFEVGHVKALLLLALVNMSQSAYGAAWLMVSHATRIIVLMEGKQSSYVSRFRHTFAGCYILDNLISLHLRVRPYLQTVDLERVGKVYEDGLEEWQPWTGCLNTSGVEPNRTPVLSLSTFNCLVEVVGMLSLTAVVDNSRNVLQEVIGRIELWKASLPSTFNHIRSEHVSIPSAPPALLLQTVYSCCSLIVYSSKAWAHRTLEILETFRNIVGLIAMPPTISNLLNIIENNRVFSVLDDVSRSRLQEFRSQLRAEWRDPAWNASASATNESPAIHSQASIADPRSTHSGRSHGLSMPSPDSIQLSYNTPTGRSSNAKTTSSLLDDLLPDMNPASVNNRPTSTGLSNARPLNAPSFDTHFNPPVFEPPNSTASRDIESFFDELASLDGAEGLGTQPQFMQNLGFAPDANISDLFASDFGQQYNPLVSPYVQQGGANAAELPNHYFDQT
ncbi:hypothetical protein K491DRAFT_522971 [Lophiostoma macrostomum CBS 122681]|uniref:Zn(2)-C6 fungal-type domain-containing protein n=1 Tax=Lophiostoma macrostomum CBS 122681 TaxID=1314788 RepID=A0A6A6T0N5_9PLEO|nr:hypothetical protein K491DRAFT_522971 [Lophiostoma macrostomum CBS 122681]